jgi:P-type Cu+ transporter
VQNAPGFFLSVALKLLSGIASSTACSLQILNDAGFQARIRDPSAGGASAAAVVSGKWEERKRRLAKVTRALALAWLLAGTCFAGHLLHCWAGIHTAPALVQFIASTEFHAVLSYAALLGPGRGILLEGFRALRQGRPDMNTLVALGAVSALGVSTAAAALPAMGWATFFEEPAMLLGVVLLGRALEERSKLQVQRSLPTCRHAKCCAFQALLHVLMSAHGVTCNALQCSLPRKCCSLGGYM